MTLSDNDIENACAEVQGRFPFPGYFEPALGGHRSTAATVARHLPQGSALLDCGGASPWPMPWAG